MEYHPNKPSTITNCTPTIGLPWDVLSSTATFTTAPTWAIQIRAVANGFVVSHFGKEFVFNTVKQLNEYLAKNLQDTK